MRTWTSPKTSTKQVQSIQAVVHRLQRIHEGGALSLGEFLDIIRCSDESCAAMQHGEECAHPKVIGVYRAFRLGLWWEATSSERSKAI